MTKRLGKAGLYLAALWIFGSGLFFLVRFTAEFYRANETAIDSAWRAMTGN